MESTIQLSSAAVGNHDDYRISKSKPGRKLSQEPAKTKRNEQVRNAQRKYRAKNKQKMESLEAENDLLRKRIEALEKQLAGARLQQQQQQQPLEASFVPVIAESTASISESSVDVAKLNADLDKLLKADFQDVQLQQEDILQLPFADYPGLTFSDKFVDDLYGCMKSSVSSSPLTASTSTTIDDVAANSSASSTDKFKFVYVNKNMPPTKISNVDNVVAAKAHQFINTANCNSAAMNNTRLTCETENIRVEELDDFIANSVGEQYAVKDSSTINFNEIINNLMKGAINFEEVFQQHPQHSSGDGMNNNNDINNDDTYDFFKSGFDPESQFNDNGENFYNNDSNNNKETHKNHKQFDGNSDGNSDENNNDQSNYDNNNNDTNYDDNGDFEMGYNDSNNNNNSNDLNSNDDSECNDNDTNNDNLNPVFATLGNSSKVCQPTLKTTTFFASQSCSVFPKFPVPCIKDHLSDSDDFDPYEVHWQKICKRYILQKILMKMKEDKESCCEDNMDDIEDDQAKNHDKSINLLQKCMLVKIMAKQFKTCTIEVPSLFNSKR